MAARRKEVNAVAHVIRMWAGAAVGTLAAGCSDGPVDPLVENPNVPARIVVVVGDAQTGVMARALADDPTMRVENDAGVGIDGATVRFTVVQGDGTIEFETAVSDSTGEASGGKWTLGALPGENRLQVSVAALAPVEIVAHAESPYSIETRIVGTITRAQRAAVDAAVERWQSVIVSELDDVALVSAANSCFQGQPAISENVDDLLIFVEFADIDGVGGVLGQAGPCYVRTQGTLPIMGFLQLDARDLAQLELSGMLNDVVLHEIGHVIGIGTIWPDLGLLAGAGGADPLFTGAGAISAYRMVGGLGHPDATDAVAERGRRFRSEGQIPGRHVVAGRALSDGSDDGRGSQQRARETE